MKLFVYLLVLIPIASLSPAPPKGLYFPEEDDPEHKRYIRVEKEDGTIEVIDAVAQGPELIKDVIAGYIWFDLYNTEKTADGNPYRFNLETFDEAQFRKFYDQSKYTLFVVHDWRNDAKSDVNQLIRMAALTNYDINLIVVDWSHYADSRLYYPSKESVPGVGNFVGQLVMKIQNLTNVDGDKFVLIGYGLGAHVAGFAGKAVNKANQKTVQHIIGLDPASPLYSVSDKENRLADSDAKVVQVLHTSGALVGFMSAIGTVDYYPNGGAKQRGCGEDPLGGCSHKRAYLYLTEAIIRGEVFIGHICTDYETYEKGNCDKNPKGVMGRVIIDNNHIENGTFFLDTNPVSPYGRGDVPPL